MKRFAIKNSGLTVLRLKKASLQDDAIKEKAMKNMLSRIEKRFGHLDRLMRHQFKREDTDVIRREKEDQSLSKSRGNYGRITK